MYELQVKLRITNYEFRMTNVTIRLGLNIRVTRINIQSALSKINKNIPAFVIRNYELRVTNYECYYSFGCEC